jgi:hypothetical protein
MVRPRQCGSAFISVVIVLILIIVVAGVAWSWYSSQRTTYVFSPCPGLTVTSRVTTGIWNCPNQPASSESNSTFTEGQFVTVTGTWATGYGTLGCVPQTGQSSCAVPQIASLQNYVHANIGGGMWFVVKWKQGTVAHLTDGQTVTISGTLQAIQYSSNPGATYPIYHLNNQTGRSDLLQPQPSFEITDAVLS